MDNSTLASGDLNATTDQFNTTATNSTDLAQHDEPTEEEMQHAVLIFYLVLIAMLFAQTGLVAWRKKHRRSYDLTTLMGLWLIPPITAIQLQFWRFVVIWLLYSIVTAYFLYACTFQKMDRTLPKKIYRWFFLTFKTSVGIGITGYILLLINVFGSGFFLVPILFPDFALLAIWYGLYFGILTRDCAEVASDRIAAAMGTARRMAVSVRDCAICGGELQDAHGGVAINGQEPSVQLSCKHLFHPDCIRGWLIVGKKDSCPTCQEKVDLRVLYANKPWETRNLSWIQMLDAFRYMIVWQPTILIALHFVFHMFGLDNTPEGAEGVGAGNSTLLVVNNNTLA